MRLTYLKNGETLSLDPALCKGCRTCIDVCPHAVFRMVDGVSIIADRESCMECGACMRNCAHGALRVQAGVGCAAAVIGGMLRGTAAECGGGACCGPRAADEKAAKPLAVAESTKPGCCATRP
jgi:NAD-dependent dihydropyrimidine dehydrogenase PreA subunit